MLIEIKGDSWQISYTTNLLNGGFGMNDQLWRLMDSGILFSRPGASTVFKPKLSGSA